MTDPQLAKGRARVFGLTWISYASYYLGRKGLSVTKARLVSRMGVSEGMLAAIDTAYLVAYALGQFASGILGDRFGARRLVGWGMLGSAAMCALFGASSASWVFLVAFGINGLAQATGWPGNTKAMAAWFTGRERGVVMGFWSTCYQAGGLAATALATLLLTTFGWRAAFLAPSVWLAGIAALVLFLLPDAGPQTAAEPVAAVDAREAVRADRARVLGSVTVWSYGAAYFCVKLIRYSLLFWLPYYLHTALGYAEGESGYLSISFEVGGIVGSVAFGLFSDRVVRFSRSVVALVGLLALAAALVLYARVAALGAVANFAGMALVGAFLFGPDSLLAGAAAQDLGGRHGAATATGFVNGMGSVGAILQGLVTVGIRQRFGWSGVFWVFVVLAALGAVCLVPAVVRPSESRSGT